MSYHSRIGGMLAGVLLLTLTCLAATPAPAFTYRQVNLGSDPANWIGDGTGAYYTEVDVGAEDVGNTFRIKWLLPAGVTGSGGATPFDLTGYADVTVDRFQSNRIDLSFFIMNNTDNTLDPGFMAAIMSFGFGVDPDALVDFTENGNSGKKKDGTIFNSVGTASGGGFPGGYKEIDVCAWAANNCEGGAIADGLGIGDSDSFSLTLTPETTTFTDPTTFSVWPVKLQSDAGSFEIVGNPSAPVPEPGTLMLLGAWLIGARYLRRRPSTPMGRDRRRPDDHP